MASRDNVLEARVSPRPPTGGRSVRLSPLDNYREFPG